METTFLQKMASAAHELAYCWLSRDDVDQTCCHHMSKFLPASMPLLADYSYSLQ